MPFYSKKVYPHSAGLSACFRQWRAESHCHLLHGYALQVELVFATNEKDERNWVVDFGALKPIKAYLEDRFDHKLLIARDDPHLGRFSELQGLGLVELRVVDATGCEAFAEMIGRHVIRWMATEPGMMHAWLHSVTVREHEGNSATVEYDRLGIITKTE